jgi:hypothetical protein
LQTWIDGELSPEASAAARSHVAACNVCAANAREAEQALALVRDGWHADLPEAVPTDRLRARLEERLEAMAPPMSTGILGGHRSLLRWSIAAAIVVMAASAMMLVRKRALEPEPNSQQIAAEVNESGASAQTPTEQSPLAAIVGDKPRVPSPVRHLERQQSGVNRDVPKQRRSTWIESEASRHLQQTQQLLRSIRNADAEPAFDWAYETKLSRELLNRNRLLRRRAEQQEDQGTEQMLVRVEPILLDIANLPDRPIADEVNSLKDMIHSQSLIAKLQLYTRAGS